MIKCGTKMRQRGCQILNTTLYSPFSVMTDMEEAAYSFFPVIGESHPYLSLWKKTR